MTSEISRKPASLMRPLWVEFMGTRVMRRAVERQLDDESMMANSCMSSQCSDCVMLIVWRRE